MSDTKPPKNKSKFMEWFFGFVKDHIADHIWHIIFAGAVAIGGTVLAGNVYNSINNISDNAREFNTLKTELQASISKLDGSIHGINSTVSGLTNKVGEINRSISSLEQSVGGVQQAVSGSSSKLGQLNSQFKQFKDGMGQLSDAISKLGEPINGFGSAVEDLRKANERFDLLVPEVTNTKSNNGH